MNDDTIRRQEAVDALKVAYWDKGIQSAKDDPCIVDAMTDWAIRQIKALPSAERRGRWEDIEHAPNGLLYATCSVCRKRQTIETTNYCGNCGARMVEE